MTSVRAIQTSKSGAARLAWLLCALSWSAIVAGLVLGIMSGPGVRPEEGPAFLELLVGAASVAAFAAIGALVASRFPLNPVAWMLSAAGIGGALATLAAEYATYALLAEPGSLPGGELMTSLQEWAWLPTMFVGSLVLLLFPGGRLPSSRWRPVVWLVVVGMIGVWLHELFAPGPLAGFPRDNPFGLGGSAGQIAQALTVSYSLVTVACLLSVASLVIRLRRAGGDERQQLKWLASGGVAMLLGVLATSVPGVPALLPIFLGLAMMAVAIGVGILKYRLYDIDLVINRALVYGALSAALAGTYLGSVLLLQLVLSGVTANNGLAIAGSTLAVAALFQPARRRIQAAVDRRFFRSKYDAARTLERFGTHLRIEVDLDALGDELRAVVSETMQPAHVTLWLRPPEAGR